MEDDDDDVRPMRPLSCIDVRATSILWQLAAAKAPLKLGRLVFMIACSIGMPPQDVHFFELFAGCGCVTRAQQRRGFIATSMEIERDQKFEDFNSPHGFLYAVLMILRLRPGGGCLAAIVCSSWVNLNRGTSGRSVLRPLGNKDVPSVKSGNLQASRLCLLLQLMDALKVFWVVEQPAGSLLMHHPRLRIFKTRVPVWKHLVRMLHFGHLARKATWLYSGHSWIHEVDHYRLRYHGSAQASQKLYRAGINNRGEKTYTANKHTKKSAAYPPAFGRAMARVFDDHHDELKHAAEEWATSVPHGDAACMQAALEMDCHTGWADANLGGVMDMLMRR